MNRLSTGGETNSEPEAEPVKIMLVEDESLTALDIKSSLIQLGYKVVAVVASGEDAVRMAKELRPDVILMDITLAGQMNGIQAADEIRKAYAIPIIFLTGHTDTVTLAEAKKTEPFGYLPKPSSIDILMSTIEVALYKSRADARLRESEERFHTVADFTYDWEYWIRDHNRIVYMSPSCQRTTGYSASEFIADPGLLTRIVAPEDASVYEQHMRHRMETSGKTDPEEIEFRIITRDGEVRWMHHICQPIYGSDGSCLGIRVSNRDITARKRSEENLKRMIHEQKIILDNLGVGVLFLKDRKILWTNRSLADMFGYALDEAIGSDTELFYPDRESYRKTGKEGYAALTRGEIWTGEVQMKRKNGSLIWCNLVGQAVDAANVNEGSIWLIENITDRKNMEAELVKAKNLESLGILAGGIAHDFNNILSAIIGYGSMTQMKMKPDDPFRSNIDQILEAADRAAQLTRSLLAFSRNQTLNMKPVDVNEVIQKVEKLLVRLIGEDIEFGVCLSAGPLMVLADSGQFDQVLMNLAANARDSMPRGGLLSINTESVLAGSEFSGAESACKSGEYALISVTDTGTGMDAETQKKIFEPFFTTKELGKGTGLGLAMVYGIIQQHGGCIAVQSEPGKGTTFRIYLPLVSEECAEQKQAAPPEQLSKGTETILLAEDDEALRKLVSSVLEEFGYTVIMAADGEDAIDKFRANSGRIDLLLFDMVMPGVTGKEAYDEIRAVRPDIRVIFSSGYAPEILRNRISLGDEVSVIFKPVSPAELLKKVRSVLDSGNA